MDKTGDVAKAQTTPASSVGGKIYYPPIDELLDADLEGK